MNSKNYIEIHTLPLYDPVTFSMNYPDSLWIWTLLFGCVFITGMSKTGFAGMGILSAAVFAHLFPARESTGILLPLLVLADCMAISFYRKEADWKLILTLIPPTLFGVILGYILMAKLDASTIRVVMGIILLSLLTLHIIRQKNWIPLTDQTRHSPTFHPYFLGVVCGLSTMIANAAGPVLVLLLISRKLQKPVILSTTAWFFFLFNLIKLPFSQHLGLISKDTLFMDFRLAPMLILGTIGGRWLIHRVDQKLFENVALVLTLLAGLDLVFRS